MYGQKTCIIRKRVSYTENMWCIQKNVICTENMCIIRNTCDLYGRMCFIGKHWIARLCKQYDLLGNQVNYTGSLWFQRSMWIALSTCDFTWNMCFRRKPCDVYGQPCDVDIGIISIVCVIPLQNSKICFGRRLVVFEFCQKAGPPGIYFLCTGRAVFFSQETTQFIAEHFTCCALATS